MKAVCSLQLQTIYIALQKPINQIIKAITENEQESRRDCPPGQPFGRGCWRFSNKPEHANSRNSIYQFWRQDNQPKELFSEKFTEQKLNYIHNNPVDAGIVDKAEDYLYSSARDYYYGKQCGLLEIDFLY